MPLGYAEAIAIAIPSSSFIITTGCIIIKYRKNNKSNASPSTSGNKNSFVREETCNAISARIASELKLTREGLTAGINDLKAQIRGLKP